MTKKSGVFRKALMVQLIILVSFAFVFSICFADPIIIDHTCTDLSQIPDYWLDQAKQLTIHYAHTSHGSQINSGILNLESQDPKYSIAIRAILTP